MGKNDVGKAAVLISEINMQEESHIGYCGKDSGEIESSLKEDVTDVPFWESFIAAYENDQLVGILGFDADLENKSAEIWGPFVSAEQRLVVPEMWGTLEELLPKELSSLHMFPNKRNRPCRNLAESLEFKLHSEHTVLNYSRKGLIHQQRITLVELSESYHADFITLHDKTFPSAYYNGEQIIERLNKHRKVFITKDKDKLSGYIYVEAEPKFGDSSIEFFAVDEIYRRKGTGLDLLAAALQWLFSFQSIKCVSLCVDRVNQAAINLYKKAGFDHNHDLCYYTKKIK
jgi:ribosomal protein S18 acetylase RimI-like enzyme